jgi:hypothetical protein
MEKSSMSEAMNNCEQQPLFEDSFPKYLLKNIKSDTVRRKLMSQIFGSRAIIRERGY